LKELKPEPLTRAAFAPFGDVIETEGAGHFTINQGFAERFADLAKIDVSADGGETAIGIVVANPRPQPMAIEIMERHPLGSQIFYPLQDDGWLIVVCGNPHESASFRAFRASGRQGINYAPNIWHHPLLVLKKDSRFLVVDRKGEGRNLEEVLLADEQKLKLDLV
jgi:ureidoglycolate lyase